MCGLTGGWSTKSFEALRDALPRMTDALAHRGPDDRGVWFDPEAGIALGHRRLSIVDLSEAGHQPMLSASGRFVIAYNGEIYNHLALRKELEAAGAAPVWRGHSDTETLLACVEAWGLPGALQRCIGMFALALWDRQQRSLVLARDRAGEKPLYYGWRGEVFLFGSELKALRAHPAFESGVDRDALVLFLRHNYIPSPHSIHQGIRKLPPGTLVRIRPDDRNPDPEAYWSLAGVAERGTRDPYGGTDEEAIDELERLLGRAVSGQRVADVPLGALLSGGIDSSLITALMQSQSSDPVRTFTIGFDEKLHDEAEHARAVAKHLGTMHTELRLGPEDALALIPKLPSMYDEPFADSSQLPTHLVMMLARRHVTVALSGDAGDEFFGGYQRYRMAPAMWKRVGWLPAPFLRSLAAAGGALPPSVINKLLGPLTRPLGVTHPGDKLDKMVQRLRGVESLDDLYASLLTEWPDADGLVINGRAPRNLVGDPGAWPNLANPVARMMAVDAMTYLPDDILVKVDRAAMAIGLETRAPFLDRDVMEFSWRLPMDMKLRQGSGKWILRELLYRHVPRALVDRPKMGFAIPLNQWLRGPLREWAGDLLGESRLRREGYFRPERILKAWSAHQKGDANLGYRLWSVLMFQAWLAGEEPGRR